MKNFKVRCSKDVVIDGVKCFTKGKEYEITDKPLEWLTVNDSGDDHIIEVFNDDAKNWYNEHFIEL